ncbi:MAG: hypothetical protein FJ220_01930 [Kiritimatiellaceae bacterium]|nr:hypothetical protein [Kiritimatiellaceae bacterium]
MKIKQVVFGVVLAGLFSGCAMLQQRQAVVADGVIQNSALGFSGFSFKVPEGFTVYAPDAEPSKALTELQRMAIRIYELNEEYHPRGNEMFYESFLLMSDSCCFLLVTLTTHEVNRLDSSTFSQELFTPTSLFPLYNITDSRTFEVGENRSYAVQSIGTAHEQKGWYYAKPKKNSMPFCYEACKVEGSKRDQYIVMGFALPEDSAALAEPMKRMIAALKM